MNRLLRNSKLVILGAVLALGSLTFTAAAMPAAHAAGQPSFDYVVGQGGSVYVHGEGFTPGVTVQLEVLDSSLSRLLSSQTLTAQQCSWGACFATVLTTTAGFTGSAYVVADQSGMPSTWAQTTIYHDPNIFSYPEVGPNSATIVVSGSGYYPGGTVTVQVYQMWRCHSFFCSHVLSTQVVTASRPSRSDVDYGLINAGGLNIPAHLGWVYVSTSGGASSQSNVVSLYIP